MRSFAGAHAFKAAMKPGIYETYFQKETVPFVYCTDLAEANKLIGSIVKKYPTDWMFGFDTETAPREEYLKYPQAGLSPHLSRLRLLQLYTGKGVVVFDLFKIGDISFLKLF
jgi:hypothetical protein